MELGRDLRTIVKLIEAHCDDMLGDPLILARYGERLQSLDIVAQTIGAVADMLTGADDEQTVASRLQNLRTSARAALERTSS